MNAVVGAIPTPRSRLELDSALEDALESFYGDPSMEARVDVAFALYDFGYPESYVAGCLSMLGVKLAIHGVEMSADGVLDVLASWLAANS